MKVSCQACGAKYTIADDKVRGRKVKIRCKSCGAPIVVDAQSEAPPADAAKGPGADAPPAAAPAATAAPAVKNEAWSVNLSDTDQRNMTTEEIIAGWKSGVVTNDAFVWKDGMNDWVAILESEELRNLLPAPGAAPDPTATPFGPTIVTAPVAAAATKGLPAARVTGGRARGGVDLFDAVEGGGGEEEVATSAPAFPGMAGTQPYDDGKLTGARNENSVLFSLDALKGGLTVDPRMKPAPARDVASDPLVAGPASLGGGGSPLFSLSADQALLTAPAPPDPPPRAADTGEGRRPAPNKLVVYGGAGAAVVAVLALGILLGQSGKDEATAEAAASASAAAEKKAAAAKEEEKKDEKKKESEEKKEEAKTEATAAAPSGSAPGKKAPVGTPSDKKTATPTTTSTSTSTGTPTEPKKEEAGPAVGTAPFSVSAAQVELTKAAGNAGSCKKPDGPTGSGKVKVTFATSGRVTSANVDGPPFAGTPVGGCVAGVFRRAKVPPFSGTSVTVSKSFAIK